MSREQLAGGDYVQLNQYKVEEGRVLGQGSYGMVKLAYNREDDKNYVSLKRKLVIIRSKGYHHWLLFHIAGNENTVQEKIAEKSRNVLQTATT